MYHYIIILFKKTFENVYYLFYLPLAENPLDTELDKMDP